MPQALSTLGVKALTTILASVQKTVSELPSELQGHALVALALTLAERLDSAALRDTPPLSKELRATLEKLEALSADLKPAELDPLDELEARRQAS
jgi:hypothetical protein